MSSKIINQCYILLLKPFVHIVSTYFLNNNEGNNSLTKDVKHSCTFVFLSDFQNLFCSIKKLAMLWFTSLVVCLVHGSWCFNKDFLVNPFGDNEWRGKTASGTNTGISPLNNCCLENVDICDPGPEVIWLFFLHLDLYIYIIWVK